VYRAFAEERMAIPVYTGRKSDSEKFAGAVRTYCIEALMQDCKALQAGTSHNLGQNFAKAFDVKFQTREGEWSHVWSTSWGVSTRLIGALVMAHGDDNGLCIPPLLAPVQIVIVPIWKSDEEKSRIAEVASRACEDLKGSFRVHADLRDEMSPGWKFNEWELKGVPLRLEIGPRDLAKGQFMSVRRIDRGKIPIPAADLRARCGEILEATQRDMLENRRTFLRDNTHEAGDYATFKKEIGERGGFFRAHWCGSAKCEEQIKTETKATIRCIPLRENREEGKCLRCGGRSSEWVYFARAY
jgi:prolyl-tRNA synthetase